MCLLILMKLCHTSIFHALIGRALIGVEAKRMPSLRSKRSRTKRTKFHISSKREKWGDSKKVEGRGWGRGKKGTLARKPLDFEKRPLVFTVEFIN